MSTLVRRQYLLPLAVVEAVVWCHTTGGGGAMEGGEVGGRWVGGEVWSPRAHLRPFKKFCFT